jgi:DUF1680 family protein
VRALFLAAGVADLAAETGEDALLDAGLAQWDDMVSSKTYLTGGVGARWEGEAFGDPYELPPDRAYCETCAAHASILWSWRLLLATGEARFAELIERTLYNAFAAGLSLPGDAYFYTNPLQLRVGGRDTSSRSARHGRQPWYRTACCPPNVMRTLSSLDHYLATADDDGIQLQQYATATVEHADARLRLETDYPWDGRVEVTLLATPSREWTLSLRLPSWCEAPGASVNGQPVDGAAEPGGYLRLRCAWRPSDTIVLDLPMPPRRTVADERIDAVHGCVAIERGPLVYCVEQADQPDLDHVQLTDGALTVRHQPELLGGVHVIEAPGSVVDASEHTGLPYHDGTDGPATRPVQLTAIPYYAWANRTVGPMRVWIPSAEP